MQSNEYKRTTLERAVNVEDSQEWRDAALFILGGRGTRDALIVRLAQEDRVDEFALAVAGLEIDDKQIDANRDAVMAIAMWRHDDPLAGVLAARTADWHAMNSLLVRMVERDLPADVWLERMATMSVDVCLAYQG